MYLIPKYWMKYVCVRKYVSIRGRRHGRVVHVDTCSTGTQEAREMLVWLVFFTVVNASGRHKFPSRTELLSVAASLLLQTSKVTDSRHQFSNRIESKRGSQAS